MSPLVSTDAQDRPGMDIVGDAADARTLVLLCPGGESDSHRTPARLGYAAARMWPWARTAVRYAHDTGTPTQVAVLRYRYSGWNGADADPLVDLRSVLASLPDRIERVVLIGHSLGGRTVVRGGDDPRVAAVLAFAPWLDDGDPMTDLSGRLVVFAHGTLDHVTDPRATRAYARRLREAHIDVAMISIAGDGHPLLRRSRDTDTLTRHVLQAIDGEPDPYLTGIVSADPDRPDDVLPTWHTQRTSAPAGIGETVRARLRLPVRRKVGAISGSSGSAGSTGATE